MIHDFNIRKVKAVRERLYTREIFGNYTKAAEKGQNQREKLGKLFYIPTVKQRETDMQVIETIRNKNCVRSFRFLGQN